MTHPVKGVDHAFLLTDDLDAAADQWRRLGFTLSPRGTHSIEKGTANYTIIFQQDYFELLGVITPVPGNQHQRDAIANDGVGLRAIANRIDDAQAARRALTDLGIATEPVTEFSRPLPLPDGSTGTAAFATTPFARGEAPRGFVFMCQHKTRDMVWRPELQDHANGAQALAGIVAVTDAPEAEAQAFARLYAAGAVSPITGGFKVATGPDSAPILLLTPTAAAARWSPEAVAGTPAGGFAALRIAVADAAKARAVIEAAGLRARSGPGGFWIGPEDAAGTIVEFATA